MTNTIRRFGIDRHNDLFALHVTNMLRYRHVLNLSIDAGLERIPAEIIVSHWLLSLHMTKDSRYDVGPTYQTPVLVDSPAQRNLFSYLGARWACET